MLSRFQARLGFVVVVVVLGLLAGGVLAQASRLRVSGAPRAQRASLTPRQRAHLLSDYGRLPLSFEANRGQFDRGVAFRARAGGSTLFLTAAGGQLAVPQAARRVRGGLPRARDAASRSRSYSVLGLRLSGARRGLWPAGAARLPGRVNYLIGRDRSRWHTDVPTFGRVVYAQAWRGIDVSFSGQQRQIEYAFSLKPRADPARIALRLTGARSARVERNGDLLVRLAGGVVVRERAPHAYQRTGDGRRVVVASRYQLSHDRLVGFRLGAYDHRRQLVIDPNVALDYSTYLGGTGGDAASGIAVDAQGAAYVTGGTGSTDFPTKNARQPRNAGGAVSVNVDANEAFVTKFSPDGRQIVYSTYLGGSGTDTGHGIAVDALGAAYITGGTQSSDFPTTSTAVQQTNHGGNDAFVTKLTPDGSQLAYSTYLGGKSDENVGGIAVDTSGDAYVTGITSSPDFPTRNAFGIYRPSNNTSNGGFDVFVTEFNPDASQFVYSSYLGGANIDAGRGIAVDAQGAAYVTGYTNAPQAGTEPFPTTGNTFQTTTAPGTRSAFLTKVRPGGGQLVYSTVLGGSSGETIGNGVAVDGQGAAYITGDTCARDLPTKNAYQPNNNSVQSPPCTAFVTKFSSDASQLVYSTYLGGTGGDAASGIAVDSQGAAYVTGGTFSSDFPVKNAFQTSLAPSPAGYGDAFVTKFSPDGSQLAYSTYLGGSGPEGSAGIALDAGGGAYVTGSTGSRSNDFPTANAYQATFAGGTGDAFVTKFAPFGAPVVRTGAASGVAPDSATLNGSVNPNGQVTTYHFEYGTSSSYGQRTADTSAGSGSADQAVSGSVTGLGPMSTYHFRLVASSINGISNGADQVFTTSSTGGSSTGSSSNGPGQVTTPSTAPAAMTLAASNVGRISATLNASVNPNAHPTSYRFDYGATTAYGTSTPTQSAGAGSSSQAVSAALSGLTPRVTYHFRLVATSASGITSGGDLTFTTRAPLQRPKRKPPTVTDTGKRSAIVSPAGYFTIPGLTINCPRIQVKEECTASVTVTVQAARPSAIRAARAARASTVIAKARFTIAAGRRASLRVRLNARGRHLLTARRRLRVNATIRIRNRAGTTRHAKSFVLLARPARHHHR